MGPRRLRAPLSVLVLVQVAPGRGSSTALLPRNLRSQSLSNLRGGGGDESRAVASSSRRRRAFRTVAASDEMIPAPDSDTDSGGGRGASVDAVGGGAINEKPRTYVAPNREPASASASALLPDSSPPASAPADAADGAFDPASLSHAMHALLGLDRYPTYLSRWSEGDADRLEASLERQLDLVRRQRASIAERRGGIALLVRKAVEEAEAEGGGQGRGGSGLRALQRAPESWNDVRDTVLDRGAAEAIFRSKMFRGALEGGTAAVEQMPPSVQEVLGGGVPVELDPAHLEPWLDQELFDVYSFPLLRPDFCARVRDLVRRVSVLGEAEEHRHLNLGRRPVDLDSLGLGWLNDLMLHLIARPLSRHLFAETERFDDLDWRQGYVAGYSRDPSAVRSTPRQRLVSHTDDSEVTLNVGFGNVFEGGALRFRGLRGTGEEGDLVGEVQPRLGTALLHAGRHLHEVTEVSGGDRYAYIVWARSWKSLRASTCPCCWINRRQDSRCVCDSRWN